MIDGIKTSQLRERLQKEKEKLDNPEIEQSDRGITLFFLAAFYLLFYGSQYLILKKFNYVPFGMLESSVIFLALRNLFRNKL